jgi:hypothetical protein
MNPPWTATGKFEKDENNKYKLDDNGKKIPIPIYDQHMGGPDFIAKAISLLKRGGKLIGITNYTTFTDIRYSKITDNDKKKGIPNYKKGTFNYLVKNGFFERIETFKGQTSRDYFRGKGDWCWFIWENDPKRVGQTIIVNKLGEEFLIRLNGNEIYTPQSLLEKEYFDWDKGNKTTDALSNHFANCDGIYVVVTRSQIKAQLVAKGDKFGVYGMLFRNTSPYVFEKLNKKIDLYTLYGVSQSGDRLRCPPLRRDLEIIFKREDIERMCKIIDKANQRLELPISDQRRNDLEKLKINLQLKINEYLDRIKRESFRLHLTNYLDLKAFKDYISFVENNDELTDEELQEMLKEYNGEG